MQVVCPKCGAPITGDNIDVPRNHAVCKPCGEIVPLPSFGAPAGELALATPSELAAPTPRALAPGDAHLSFRPSTLPWKESGLDGKQQFALAPRRLQAVPLLAFAGVWNMFLFFWYSTALVSHGGPGGMMFWFPLLHVGAGIYITYLGLGKLLNTARMEIDRERVRIGTGPVPQRGGRIDEPLGNVRGFDAWRQVQTGRRAGDTSVTWRVRMLTLDGRSVALPLDVGDNEQAEWVARRLNRALDDAQAPHSYRD